MESVLHFCERQQQRLHAADQSSADAEAASAPPSSPIGAAPPSTSSLSAPTTVAWLRMLCTDMLSSLHSASPGCLRAHMERQYLHSAALAAARPTKEPFVTTGRGKNKQKKQTVSERKLSARVTTALLFSAWPSVVAQFVLCPCFVCVVSFLLLLVCSVRAGGAARVAPGGGVDARAHALHRRPLVSAIAIRVAVQHDDGPERQGTINKHESA